MSTVEVLKANKREDLCTEFTHDLRIAMAEWQTKKNEESITPVVTGDNFMEENMDVDDEEEAKEKKPITPTTPSASKGERKDVDDHSLILAGQEQNRPPVERKRKSRFSDIVPKNHRSDDEHHRTKSLNLIAPKETVISEKQRPTTCTYTPSAPISQRFVDVSRR